MATVVYSQPQVYIGLRGGAGAAINYQKLQQVESAEGFKDAVFNDHGYSGHLKAEALFGIKHFRIGYRFMYLRSSINAPAQSYAPITDEGRYNFYFNSSRTILFAHYGVIEIPLINSKHFALTPAIAAGGFTGYTIDKDTKNKAQISSLTKNRFSVGAELNAEIKFGRVVIVAGPNYYLFNNTDRATKHWNRYTHVIGADVGLRVNLLKP